MRVITFLGAVVFFITILELGDTSLNKPYNLPNWSSPTNISGFPTTHSLGPTVTCDSYQNLHIFWGEWNTTENITLINYSNYEEGSWSQPIDIFRTSSIQDLFTATTSDNYIHLSWTDTTSKKLYYTRTHLSQARQVKKWAEPISLATDVERSYFFADISEKILYNVYTIPSIGYYQNDIYMIISQNYGETWSQPIIIEAFNHTVPSRIEPLLAIDGNKRFHLALNISSLEYGVKNELVYIRSLSLGTTWEGPKVIASSDTPPGVARLAIYPFDKDEVHITYDLPERMHQWSNDGGDTWSSPQTIVNGVEIGAAFGGWNFLVKDGNGTIHVVYAWAKGVYHATLANEVWSKAELIESRDFDPHRQSITLCQGNRLNVFYYDRLETQDLWYSYKDIDIPQIPSMPIPEAPDQQPETIDPVHTPLVTQKEITALPLPTFTQTTLSDFSLGDSSQKTWIPTTIGAFAAFVLIVILFVVRRFHK